MKNKLSAIIYILIYSMIFFIPLIYYNSMSNPYEFKLYWGKILLSLINFLIVVYLLYIRKIKINVSGILLFIYVIWLTLTVFQSKSFTEWYDDWLYLYSYFYIFIFLYQHNNKHFLNIITKIVFTYTTLIVIYSIIQYFGYDIIGFRRLTMQFFRITGTVGNPNFLAATMLISLILLLNELYHITRFTLSTLFYTVLMILTLITIFLTKTRSVYLMVIFTVLIYIFIFSKKYIKKGTNRIRIFILPIIILFILLILLVPNNIYKDSDNNYRRLTSIFEDIYGKKGTVMQRYLMYKITLSMIRDNPIIGIGYGNYDKEYGYYQSLNILNYGFKQYETHSKHAHSMLIELIGISGIIGFGLFAVFIMSLFYTNYKYLLLLIIVILLQNLVSVSYFYPSIQNILFILIICIMIKEKKLGFIRLPDILKFILVIINLSILIYSGKRYVNKINGSIKQYQAERINYNINLEGYIQELKGSSVCDKDNLNVFYKIANYYMFKKEYRQALIYYHQINRIDNSYKEVHHNIGKCYQMLGKKYKALKYFHYSYNFSPYYKPNLEILAQSYRKNNNVYNGLFYLKRMVDIFGSDYKSLFNISTGYTDIGMLYKAVRYYLKCCRKYRQNMRNKDLLHYIKGYYYNHKPSIHLPETDHNRINDLIKQKKWNQLERNLNKLIKKYPNEYLINFYYSNILVKKGKYAEAIKIYKKLFEFDPMNYNILVNLSNVYKHINNRDMYIKYMKMLNLIKE